jgi:gliding motility associated protien GldN
MRYTALLLFLFLGNAVLAFQEENNGSSTSGSQEEYLLILEEAKKSVKEDASLVKVANLSSHPKQSDSASVRPIREADVMFKVRLWSTINFQEKINTSFMADKTKLVDLIYEGVNAYFEAGSPVPTGDGNQVQGADEGLFLIPYKANEDSTAVDYEKSEFYNKQPITDPATFDGLLTNVNYEAKSATPADLQDIITEQAASDPEFMKLDRAVRESEAQKIYDQRELDKLKASLLKPSNQTIELDQILIEEDLIFDKNHSVPKWDIISITVLSPSDGPTKKLFKIKYADLKRYLDVKYKETGGSEAFWFNAGNPGSTALSYADAFEKRLFNAHIVSVENVDNQDILSGMAANDGYNSLVFAEKIRLQLLERMHNLWEY